MSKNKSARLQKEQSTSFAQNVIMLAAAQIVVKLLGLVYKIVIVNVPGFGDEGNGYYSTGYQLYMVLLALSSIGLPNVISKMVSERVAIGDYKGAHRVFTTTFKIFSIFGIALSVLMFAFARPISIYVFNAEGVAYTIMALAPAVAFSTMNSVLRGYFTGLGSLKSTSISEIIEQFFNCVLSIGFVYLMVGNDTAIMAAAGNLSTTCAIVISLGYMFSHFLLRKKYLKEQYTNQTVPTEDISTLNLSRSIIALAIPSAFASLVSTLSSNIDAITVNNYTDNVYAYGIISKTETLTHMPLALSATLYIAIVPVIASLIKIKDNDGAEEKLSNTLFLSIIVLLPCALGFSVLAEPILKLLYPASYEGAYLLQLQTVAMIFAGIIFVLNGVLYGLGKQKYCAWILLIGAILKLILNVVFMKYMKLSYDSAVISTIIYQALVMIAELVLTNKYVKIKLEFIRHIVKPIIATVIMGVAAYFTYSLLYNKFGNNIATIVAIFIGVVVYLILILLLGIMKEKDYNNLPMGSKIYALLRRLRLVKYEGKH